MRKIIHFMHVSLDGFVATSESAMDWITVDEEIFDFVGERTSDGDTALYGRVTYQMMDAYWPTAGDQPDASKHDIDHSRWYNRVEKVVVSRSLKGLDKPKTRVVSDNLAAEIGALKAGPGKDILIFGSPRAAQALAAEDLIDGYWLFINPILLGAGAPLFGKSDDRRTLQLTGSHTFRSGVVCVSYERVR